MVSALQPTWLIGLGRARTRDQPVSRRKGYPDRFRGSPPRSSVDAMPDLIVLYLPCQVVGDVTPTPCAPPSKGRPLAPAEAYPAARGVRRQDMHRAPEHLGGPAPAGTFIKFINSSLHVQRHETCCRHAARLACRKPRWSCDFARPQRGRQWHRELYQWRLPRCWSSAWPTSAATMTSRVSSPAGP